MEKMKTFSVLCKESFNLYKTNFKFLISIILLSNFPGVILQGVGKVLNPYILTTFYSVLANVLLIAIIPIISWVLIVLGNIATIIAIKELKQGQKASITSVYSQSIKLFLPVLIVLIIQTVIVMGGFVLFIAPGVIFSIWYIFSIYSAVIHKKRKAEALALSKAVVRASIGRVIGFMVLVEIIAYGPYIFFYIMAERGIFHSLLPYLSGVFVSGIIDSILTVWAISFSFIFYKNLIKSEPKISEEFTLENL